MQTYIETSVYRKNNFNDYLKCFLCCILPLLVGTYLVMLMSAVNNTVLLALSLIACALLYYLSYKIFCNFSVEWEYTLVGDEIRFSKITNKSKRRDMFTIPLSKVEAVAIKTSGEYNSIMRGVFNAKYNFTSQTKADVYVMSATTQNGKRVAVHFEPSEKMLENFKTTLRGKLYS